MTNCACGRPWFVDRPGETLCLWCDAAAIISLVLQVYGENVFQ